MKILKALFWTIVDFLFLPIHYLPGQVASRVLRPLYWKLRLKKLGHRCIIDVGVQFSNPEYISIGDNTWIDRYVVLLAGRPTYGQRRMYKRPNRTYTGKEGELEIGNRCHVAPFVIISGLGGVRIGNNVGIAAGSTIYSLAHHYRNLADRSDDYLYKYTPMIAQEEQTLVTGPVVIEDNAGITLNVSVLPGVTIGEYTWITPYSQVRDDVPPGVIAGGNPCQVLKPRKR